MSGERSITPFAGGGDAPLILDKSILIHASPERVFAWLSPARQPAWDKSLVRAAGADLAQGARFGSVHRTVGCRFETMAQATDVETGRRFAWRQLAGDYAIHEGAYTLEAVPDGTLLHLRADVEMPYALPRLVTEDELRNDLSRQADDALFNLKALVERSRAAG